MTRRVGIPPDLAKYVVQTIAIERIVIEVGTDPGRAATANVEAAIKRHGITYPVAHDNNFATWNAYGNQYWPAQYILDKDGRVAYQHAGEGQYDTIEKTIQGLLNAAS